MRCPVCDDYLPAERGFVYAHLITHDYTMEAAWRWALGFPAGGSW